MNDVVIYLILALVISPVSVMALCFVGKLIKLKREYTELIIPIIGSLIFLLIFQIGLTSLVEKYNLGAFLNLIGDIIVSILISQGLYVLCRKFGNKSAAAKKHWIFIGVFFFLTILCAAVSIVISQVMPINKAGELLKDFIISDAYLIPTVSVVFLLVFILMAFNMVLYKLTKEISFAIRRKRG